MDGVNNPTDAELSRAVAEKLKPCPCGQVPGKLNYHLTQGYKWMSISGDCCGGWEVEGRTMYEPEGSDELYALAVETWNDAPRAACLAILEE